MPIDSNFPQSVPTQLMGPKLSVPEAMGADADRAEAAQEFEVLMATMLVKEMRRGLPDGFFGSGPGSDTFEGWLDKSIGEDLAQNWDLNLAGMVKANLDSKQARLEGPQQPNEGSNL